MLVGILPSSRGLAVSLLDTNRGVINTGSHWGNLARLKIAGGTQMNNFSIQSLYNWYRNTLRNPKYRWWMILGTLLYIFSPIDIAPDFIPFIGQIDDIAVLTLLVSEVSQLLIDGAKSRKGDKVASTSNSESTSEKTVDVDAVSVR
jgi:uncharacterized membrane protein YkvA (DUF1232 family)